MKFLNYLLKAKGRHGTHSPYIYKFVEDALHENNALTPAYPRDVAGRKARTLFRVLSYLIEEGQQLITSSTVMQSNAWLQHFNPVVKRPDQIFAVQSAITVLSLEEVDFYKDTFFSKETSSSGRALILLHPGNPDDTLLEACFKREQFNATIFTWDFSILMDRPDFKRKQHFILR